MANHLMAACWFVGWESLQKHAIFGNGNVHARVARFLGNHWLPRPWKLSRMYSSTVRLFGSARSLHTYIGCHSFSCLTQSGRWSRPCRKCTVCMYVYMYVCIPTHHAHSIKRMSLYWSKKEKERKKTCSFHVISSQPLFHLSLSLLLDRDNLLTTTQVRRTKANKRIVQYPCCYLINLRRPSVFACGSR
ncbi:hypothetical protein K504DRAFT_203799 [Pleomassaria siparia CBS 279.74]|uniref:Uncharacterized protein n=1 Tax=Pleomassaria siparia CBS 279.74 TaxID=1314801 RepID=A0A6G1KJ69_9PLEO|nr:hypothetical protein K504DRAFT_203799 [Pleomassaria siparia CBS 279.74]